MKRFSCLLASGGALLFATVARADDATNAAVATELFNAGRALMQQGNYGAACPKLLESARLDPKAGTFAKRGECDEHEGRLASARGRWQQALNLARTSHDPREARVATELARVDARVPKLRVALAPPTPAGVTVRVDELDIGAGALGVPLPVDPGDHVVRVGAPGKKAWSTRVSVAADGRVLAVDVPALDDAPVSASTATSIAAPTTTPARIASPEPGPPPAEGARPLRVAGFVAIGAGGVAAGIGGFFGIRAIARYHASNDAGCNGAACPPGAATIRDEARSLGNASTAAFVAAGTLLASGVVLVVLAPSPSATITATPIAGPRTAGLALEGAW